MSVLNGIGKFASDFVKNLLVIKNVSAFSFKVQNEFSIWFGSHMDGNSNCFCDFLIFSTIAVFEADENLQINEKITLSLSSSVILVTLNKLESSTSTVSLSSSTWIFKFFNVSLIKATV